MWSLTKFAHLYLIQIREGNGTPLQYSCLEKSHGWRSLVGCSPWGHWVPNVSVHSRGTWFPCTASTFTPRIDSHHGGTCDSPVGKPRGKATDPCVNATGSLTLLLQLGRKADFHVSTLDEAWLPCGDSRGTPRSMSALERKLQVPALAPTGEESGEAPRNSHGDWPFLRPHE